MRSVARVAMPALLSVIVATADAAEPAFYTVVELRVPNAHIEIRGMNNAGQIAGSTWQNSARDEVAVRFDFDGSAVSHVTLCEPRSIAVAIDDAGRSAGYVSKPDVIKLRAVYFGLDGAPAHRREIDAKSGSDPSIYASSGAGRLAGSVRSGGANHAALFTVTGSRVTATVLDQNGSLRSDAAAVNNAGLAVGTATAPDTNRSFGVLFDPGRKAAVPLDLGYPAWDSCASAINDEGVIGGYVQSPGGPLRAMLFRVDRKGKSTRTDLGVQGYVSALNNSGQALGLALPARGAGQSAFLYSATDGVKSLTGLLEAPYAHGLKLTSNLCLNDWGQIALTGYLDRIKHALLLNPVTPHTRRIGDAQRTRLVAGMSYDLTPPLAHGSGGPATGVRLPDGKAGGGGKAAYGCNRDLWQTWSRGEGALTDTLSLAGTGGDTFVLCMTYVPAAAARLFGQEEKARLCRWNPAAGRWENAAGAGQEEFVAGAYESAGHFHAGCHGVDTAAHAVWAVVTGDGDYAVAAPVR